VPISYSIDRQHNVILETWVGEIRRTDLENHWKPYLEDPEVLAIRRTLVDLRKCTIRFTGAELTDLVSGLVLPAIGGRDWKTAMVVEHPVQFGVSRQYQVLAETYSTDCVFSDLSVAIAWLLAR
jgi:hypothetical protein